MSQRSLNELVSPDWAAALAPVAGIITGLGLFLRAELAAGRSYLPAGQRRAARVHPAAQRGQGADRRAGPLPHPWPPGRAVVLRRSGGTPGPRLAAEHLRRAAGRPRHSAGRQRRPDPVVRAGRAAAQPGAYGATRPLRLPSRARLGAGDRPGPSRPWPPGAGRSWPSCGAATPSPWFRCSGLCPTSPAPHPSPLSARSGFFGSRPFSRANELLVRQGGEPVNWALPALLRPALGPASVG